MLNIKASILLVAGALMVLPGIASAQLGKSSKGSGVTSTAGSNTGAVTEQSLVQRYETLAGSADNAKSLVNGVRNKFEIVLVGPMVEPPPAPPPTCTPGTRFCKEAATTTPVITDETIKFVPSTTGMGWGNVDIALALAEADLKAKSVHTVKPRHLKAALEGGTVGGVTFEGILAMRAAGAGWGDIAKSLGFELK